MKDKAIVDLLSDKSLNELADKIAGDNSGDLIQEVALLLLEMEEEKWTEINEGGYLRWRVWGVWHWSGYCGGTGES